MDKNNRLRWFLIGLVIWFFLLGSAYGAPVTANFIVGFDPTTRQTLLPKDAQGQPIPVDFCHLTPEKNGTIVVQVRAEQVVIDAMKLDTKYFLLEDKPVDPATPAVISVSPTAVKTYLGKTMTTTDINKQVWTTPTQAVEAVVKLHNGKLADYKSSGLGQVSVAPVKVDPIKIEPAPVKEPVVIGK